MPVVGLEAQRDVLGEGEVGATLDGDLVVVVEVDELAELSVPASEAASEEAPSIKSPSEDDAVGVVVYEAGAYRGGEIALGHGHADAHREALTQRPRGRLHPRGVSVLGMPGGLAAPLPEALDLLERQVVAVEVQ